MYNYIFYRSYLIGKRYSESQVSCVIRAIGFLMLGIVFQIGAILFFLNDINLIRDISSIVKSAKLWNLFVLCIISFYYFYKKRYERIIAKYEKSDHQFKRISWVIILMLYWCLSFILLFLAGNFKTGKWPFS